MNGAHRRGAHVWRYVHPKHAILLFTQPAILPTHPAILLTHPATFPTHSALYTAEPREEYCLRVLRLKGGDGHGGAHLGEDYL